MRRKERSIAILAAVLGASVLLVWSGIELRARIIEGRALQKLRSSSKEEREAGALALGEIASVRSLPAILGAIAELKPPANARGIEIEFATGEARYLAEVSVRQIIDRRGVAVVPVLVRLLERGDADVERLAGKHVHGVREAAAKWLAEIGPEARAAVPALKAAFKRTPPVVTAAEALIEIGCPGEEFLPDLIPRLRGDVEDSVVEAIRLMGRKGKEAIPALVECVGRRVVRKEIVSLLAQRGPDSVQSLCLVLLNLGDRRILVEAILEMEPGDILPVLLEMLEGETDYQLDVVCLALERLGPQARAAVPTLIRRARVKEAGGDGYFWHDALVTLGAIGVASPEVIVLLQEALADQNDNSARPAAAKALARLGPSAAQVFPGLEHAAQHDSDLRARLWATCAIAKMDPGRIPGVTTSMVEILTRGGEQEEDKVYFPSLFDDGFTSLDTAAAVLGELGPAAKDAVPSLVDLCLRLFEKDDREALKPTLRALSKIGVDAEALRRFTAALRHPHPERRNMALYGLHELGPAAKPAIPAIKAALQDVNLETRVRAAVTLGKLDPSIREAITVLREALGVRERWLRDNARYYLERYFEESP